MPSSSLWPTIAAGAVPGADDGRVFRPEQRLDLGTALAAHTAGSVNHRDDSGHARTGKVADLVVLDRNPRDGPGAEIAATKVAMTFVDGSRVYSA
ncbi:amidohydrolase family protein [Actinoplanes sp. NPDC020271]|uniref:amidohydrolase family protein n=1 Tax=Actinoplanes sp. NPDC020271 TaxID=3363896 RepID=UPI0037B03A3D